MLQKVVVRGMFVCVGDQLTVWHEEVYLLAECSYWSITAMVVDSRIGLADMAYYWGSADRQGFLFEGSSQQLVLGRQDILRAILAWWTFANARAWVWGFYVLTTCFLIWDGLEFVAQSNDFVEVMIRLACLHMWCGGPPFLFENSRRNQKIVQSILRWRL